MMLCRSGQRPQNASSVSSRGVDGDGQLTLMRLFFSKTLTFMLVDSVGKFKLGNSSVEPSAHLSSHEDLFKVNIYLY